MKQIPLFILTLFISALCYPQDTLNRDNKYLMDLEISSVNLKCDTIILTSPKQTQLITQCHKVNDTTIRKRETIYNYEASLKSSIYIRTEYFSANKKLLAWTHKSFDKGILVAGEINYYDTNDKLFETFKWGSGEVGLRTKYYYNTKGKLVKEITYRGDIKLFTKTY